MVKTYSNRAFSWTKRKSTSKQSEKSARTNDYGSNTITTNKAFTGRSRTDRSHSKKKRTQGKTNEITAKRPRNITNADETQRSEKSARNKQHRNAKTPRHNDVCKKTKRAHGKTNRKRQLCHTRTDKIDTKTKGTHSKAKEITAKTLGRRGEDRQNARAAQNRVRNQPETNDYGPKLSHTHNTHTYLCCFFSCDDSIAAHVENLKKDLRSAQVHNTTWSQHSQNTRGGTCEQLRQKQNTLVAEGHGNETQTTSSKQTATQNRTAQTHSLTHR